MHIQIPILTRLFLLKLPTHSLSFSSIFASSEVYLYMSYFDDLTQKMCIARKFYEALT